MGSNCFEVCCPFPLPLPLQDLHQRAKRQNTAAILSVCKVVREMRGLEQYYAFLMAELPSRNFNRYTVLVEKFEALVGSNVLVVCPFSLSCLMCCLCVFACAAELCFLLSFSEFGSIGRFCHLSEGGCGVWHTGYADDIQTVCSEVCSQYLWLWDS